MLNLRKFDPKRVRDDFDLGGRSYGYQNNVEPAGWWLAIVPVQVRLSNLDNFVPLPTIYGYDRAQAGC